jgi:ABC-type branched-subunit amino acid transport system substrate-binding protein
VRHFAPLLGVVLAFAGCRQGRSIPSPTEPGVGRILGAVLPLSGKLAAFGERGRDAVRLAAGELDRGPDPGPTVRAGDSKGEGPAAAAAVAALIEEDGAIAIVGPLFRMEATPAADKAQELAVPLITVTGDAQVTAAGDYVFRLGVTPEDEVEALLAEAIDRRGGSRFAVLHPAGEYGQRMRDVFQQAVEARGGSVVAIESYPEDATTSTDPIRRLVQRDELRNAPTTAGRSPSARRLPTPFARRVASARPRRACRRSSSSTRCFSPTATTGSR